MIRKNWRRKSTRLSSGSRLIRLPRKKNMKKNRKILKELQCPSLALWVVVLAVCLEECPVVCLEECPVVCQVCRVVCLEACRVVCLEECPVLHLLLTKLAAVQLLR